MMGTTVPQSVNNLNLVYKVFNRMLGGGEPNYYKDGSQSSNGSRFSPENPGKQQIFDGSGRESDDNADYRDAIMNEGLKTIVDPEAKEAAKSWAKLIIQKNSAPRGAGVGSNGRLSFGTPGTTQVKVTKAWKDAGGKDLAEDKKVPVKVQLVGKVGDAKFYVGQPAELNADNNWTHVFTDLPKTKTVDGKQVEIQYFIEEQGIAGFVVSGPTSTTTTTTIPSTVSTTSNTTVTPPVVTTTKTTTATPPTVTTTATPDNSRPTLARTGANVGATVTLALALIGLDLVLTRRKRS